MKSLSLLTLTSAIVATFADGKPQTAPTGALTAEFADPQWNSIKVPLGQQCLKFGGKSPATPALKISDIPAGTTTLVMEYSDRDYKPMDKGGHGILAYTLAKQITEITVPSVKGHSYELPDAFFSVAPHQGPDWDKAGAYMPPCSGGNKHLYYVTIKALKQGPQKAQLLAQTMLEMGRY